MKNRIAICCLVMSFLLFLPSYAWAQEKTLIRGTITDNEKVSLPQATVIELDKDNRIVASAVADLDGNFSINMVDAARNALVVRYVGYKDQRIRVGNRRVLQIVMEDAALQLEDVVVTGRSRQNLGGMSIDSRDLSMAIGKISADEIAEVHAASIDDALQGRISGVDIVGATGNPGGGMAIRIRGLSSITGDNMPLIVVDGIPMETTVGSSSIDFSTATEEEFSQMLNIPPSDIKDIAVLKDAAAAAIYGSRGANGVLVITTKRGVISPPRINFRSTFTLDKQPEKLPTLSGYEYSTLITESLLNAGTILNPSVYPEFAYDPNNPEYYYNYSQDTDWVGALNQTGFTQDYTLSISGGSPKVRYRFSAGYWDQVGVTIGTDYNRLNTRLNLDYYVSDKLRFAADIAYTHSDNNRSFIPGGSNYNTKGDLRDKAYTKMPNQSIYYYNQQGVLTSQYYTPESTLQGRYPNVYNPVAIANDGKNNLKSDWAAPKFSLIFDQNAALQYSFDVSFQITNNNIEQYLPQTATGVVWNNNSTNWAQNKDDDTFVVQTLTKVRWMPVFSDPDKHQLIGLFGLNTYDNQSNTYIASTSNLPSAELQDPSIPSRVFPSGSISSGYSQQRSLSAYVNLHYKFKDRYIFYGSTRVDGNSRFGKEYRYGIFPALSARYRISEEPFLKNISWLDDLSFSASWGLNGKLPDKDYMFYSKYANYSYTYMGKTATYPTSVELDNLRWEKTSQYNYALNLIALQDKINVEFNYFKKETVDVIGDTSVPSTSGFSKMTMNLNTVENVGWELNVQTVPYKSKDWTASFNFNISRTENFLRKISEYADLEEGNWQNNGSYLIRLEKDQPYGAFYGYRYKGVYLNKEQTIAKDANGNPIYTMGENGRQQEVRMKFGYPSINYEFQAGDAMYEDINHDGNINEQDIVYLGDYNPLFFGGFGPTVKYKNLTVNAWFYFRYGNDIINATRMNMEKMYDFDNQSKSALKRWRDPYEGEELSDVPDNLLPRALYKTGYNWLASDRFVEDGSFLRLKTVTFRYNFPRKVANKLYMEDLNCWLTLQNLFTWTNYTGQDPEVSTNGKLSEVGRDFSQTPRLKQFTFGLSLTF